MNITKNFLNPQAIASLYEKHLPIDDAEIIDLQIKRDGPKLFIKLMTPIKPVTSPVRWPKNYDVVYLDLSFIGVRDLLVKNWGCNNIVVEFEMTDVDASAYIKILCKDSAELTFVCDWVKLEGISYGYIGSP